MIIKNQGKNYSLVIFFKFILTILTVIIIIIRDEIKESFELIYTVYSFYGYQIDWRQIKSLSFKSYLLSEDNYDSICRQHDNIYNSAGEISSSIITKPFFGPLHIKFKSTHGIYRNKRIIKYPIEYTRE